MKTTPVDAEEQLVLPSTPRLIALGKTHLIKADLEKNKTKWTYAESSQVTLVALQLYK